MKSFALLTSVAICFAVLATACTQKQEGALDRAAENTKDALDMRDNEKLKDAAENAGDAVRDAGEGIKDAAKDAAADMKEALPDPK
ncbi:MAG: hypothetical protein KDI32_10445 [Pseudomonadales bacterium]|jgi:hypothetical protein|nr:hypothetical protein [Pseudomonadales bacterium]